MQPHVNTSLDYLELIAHHRTAGLHGTAASNTPSSVCVCVCAMHNTASLTLQHLDLLASVENNVNMKPNCHFS